ncbi:N-terminal acetyltransferase A complex catalytic subunit NAA10-like [Papaver somniferum]|uniref:N-terminal acetyltransferase A complex catalytic subunit NAA10-like n=1 Tax=Papaver somniferum TaxID=3469 RepID=UPI000E6FAD91|nr:N-terminal acetyltransferase A complex catalytic subunit NAA10-like [Papaver somniferum]
MADIGQAIMFDIPAIQMKGEGTESHGYIANLGVVPTHRKLGIANKLMDAAQDALVKEYGSEHVSLHVRAGNQAAIDIYTEKLGYNYESVAPSYKDGEDAFVMRKQL